MNSKSKVGAGGLTVCALALTGCVQSTPAPTDPSSNDLQVYTACNSGDEVSASAPEWRDDPCEFTAQWLTVMDNAVREDPDLAQLQSESNLEIRVVEDDEYMPCTNTTLESTEINGDQLYTAMWCEQGYMAAVSESMKDDMESDEIAVLVFGDILLAYSDYLVFTNEYEQSNAASVCAAGLVMVSLVNEGVYTEGEMYDIADAYITAESRPHFDRAFNEGCEFTLIA